MLARYQNGCLQKATRKDGAERWQFCWLEKVADRTSRQRKKTIGPVKDYPEHSKKLQDLLAGLRLNINSDGPTKLTSVTMAAAVEHYSSALAPRLPRTKRRSATAVIRNDRSGGSLLWFLDAGLKAGST